ncbi:formylglycine-generating enzyme family protein [Puniceicoccales bacterium CK1056]|uniref:Formylglycine-generating enzyme family protein n=1 Tax=Oceanipulchritudo coccoides TaxID=2706888 RepID=A0A6B2LZE6_9BACT|nr:SUMF1/EgtB/PvdO family nonheme iron enzyme [Oceanipulchritudo coccoides]NDV60900.1 formylglycine-generating enzyme family protein [Oceanipulchritudo coccoides]
MKSVSNAFFLLPLFLLGVPFLAANVVVETVFVGGANNPPNPDDGDLESARRGAVPYDYYIGKYEVTNAQYAEFLNAAATVRATAWLHSFNMEFDPRGGIISNEADGVYSYEIKEGMANKPVTFVSLFQAMAFCNWLTNGQGAGDINSGTYQLTKPSGVIDATVVRDAVAFANGGVAVASENEWYKAAYYEPGPEGPASDYWKYPTRSNLEPAWVQPNSDSSNSANMNGVVKSGNLNGFPTDVGAYTLAISPSGAFDMAGNADEWNDTIPEGGFDERVLASGGSFFDNPVFTGATSTKSVVSSGGGQFSQRGFRVTSTQPIDGSVSSWRGWTIVDGYADTGSWLGWLWIGNDPWLWSPRLGGWLYSPADGVSETGGWVYVPR